MEQIYKENNPIGFNPVTAEFKGYYMFTIASRDPIHSLSVKSIMQVDLFYGNHLVFVNTETLQKRFYVVTAFSFN